MDFHLTNEQQMLRKMYREFAENEVKPLAEEIDEERAVPHGDRREDGQAGDDGHLLPQGVRRRRRRRSVLRHVPWRSWPRSAAPPAVIVSAHTSLCCAPIFEHGTEEQKQKYLPDLLLRRVSSAPSA